MEEKREEGPCHFSGVSKQNANASRQRPRCMREGRLGGHTLYIQLVTVTVCFGWHRKSADLFQFGIHTTTKVILKQLSCLQNNLLH